MINYTDKAYRQVFKYNKKIGHSYIENLETRLLHENGGYFLKTNSSGFRSNIEFQNKKGKRKRILFFGDSNTAGDGVDNNERYTELIGKELDCDVYNYAISGTGTDQQFLIWENYAKKVDADLIVLGVLVENIERIKARFRETISFYNQNKGLTPKPYFILNNNKLKLKNFPVPRFFGNQKAINPEHVQWSVPQGRETLYKIKDVIRKNKIYKYFNRYFESELDFIRSKVISNFYDPYKDYKNLSSKGSLLMTKILEKFVNSIGNKPIIIFPIPTYQYYFDGAKPTYRNLFQKFNDTKKKIYVCDPLNTLKSLNYIERKKLCFAIDKSHFSPKGHMLLSRFLINEIKKNKILKNPNKKIIQSPIEKKNNFILGISAFYHDSSASILKDGKIIAAAQEERFTRVKNDKSFPNNAINFCLETAKISPNQLSAVVYYDNSYITFERILWSFKETKKNNIEIWQKYMPAWIKYKLNIPQLIRKNLRYNGKIFHNLHHRSHLASAFFPSPFKKAAILTVDGVGEWATASYGVGEGNKITMLEQMNFPNSVGLLYSAFTSFIGFEVNEGEYKMMGLAPYGKPIYVDTILNNLIQINEDGSIRIDQTYFDYISGRAMTNQKFADLFGGKALKPGAKITQRERDLAASIQVITEKIILKMVKYVKKVTKEENLCLSGGVALNCVINGNLKNQNIFKDIWVQPASGDSGSSLGCAFDLYYSYFENKRDLRSDGYPVQLGSNLGPSWNNNEIKSFLDTGSIKYQYFKNKEKRNTAISHFLKKKKVIGYFSGKAEFGPRALGSRSIIADPREKNMQTRINLKIKFRESFRPFAPAVLREKINKYFISNYDSPYMTFVTHVVPKKRLPFKLKEEKNLLKIVKKIRSDIPAVTHVDYSARIQTVDSTYNNDFYNLIKNFEKLTGCSMVINTSFNVKGEPIVNSPLDAFKCFLNTDMDILVLENFIIEKSNFKKGSDKNIKKLNWRFYWNNMRSAELEENTTKDLLRDLREVYNSLPKNETNENFDTGWVNVIESQNSKKIFEIPDALDRENIYPEEAINEIFKYWKKQRMIKSHQKSVIKILKMVRKYKKDFDVESSFVSSKVYELF